MLILAPVLALVMLADPPAPVPESPRPMPKMTPPRISDAGEGQEIWQLTLPEAIRIGLDNSVVVRVISPEVVHEIQIGAQTIPLAGFEPDPLGAATLGAGEIPSARLKAGGITIARLNGDASIWNFQAAIMAHVRSIEQQYWALSLHQVTMWSRETAVRLGEEILSRERAKLKAGRATTADVAEAEQQLENFKLNLVTAVADVITTERQLRNILGLPPADNRQIVTATPPTEARLEPDWNASLATMLAQQPDIAQQRQLVRLGELQLVRARNQIPPELGLNAVCQLSELSHVLDPAGMVASWLDISTLMAQAEARLHAAALDPTMTNHHFLLNPPIGRTPLANTRQAQYQLLRQRAFLQRIVHQTSHSLARCFLTVDANYKQFQTAQRLRAAAQQRLEAQRAFFDEGRVKIDRLLDAVSQYANASAQEAQYKATYNTAIAAFEEAKGTLLAFDGITVAETPIPRNGPAPAQPRDDQVAPTAHEAPTPKPEPAKSQPAPTVYKVRAKLGGLKVLEVEVEVNQAPNH